MAKRVWLIRHAKQVKLPDKNDIWQAQAELAPEATDRIVAAADYFKSKGVRFSIYRHSLLVRSRQTCAILKRLMGDKFPMKLNGNLGPGLLKEWNKRFVAFMREHEDWEKLTFGPVKWSSMWPDLCEVEGERVLIAVEQIARQLKDGQDAAAISHNPLIRLAEGQATGMVSDPDLNHCQAICFTFKGGDLVDSEAHLF